MNLPGGVIATRPLHFIWLADCSGSMDQDGKIQALNNAIREAIPSMRRVANENPYADVFVRAVRFSSGAEWHIPTPTLVQQFEWADLQAGGVTDLGQALKLVAGQLHSPPMTSRGLPPVLVLVSDGQPTDGFEEGLQAVLATDWGRKSVRIAIAIGQDADYDVLKRFSSPDLEPLQANNADTLVSFIKWASTAVLQSVSCTGRLGSTGGVVPVPVPQPLSGGAAAVGDAW